MLEKVFFLIGLLVFAAGLLVALFVFLYKRSRAARARRLSNSLPRELSKARELEPLLAPGETVLWEGRPIGHPVPDRSLLALYALSLLALTVLPALLVAIQLQGTTSRTWTFSALGLSVSGTGTMPQPSGGASPTPSGTPLLYLYSATVNMPAPWVIVGGVLALFGWDELRRLASWRARRYGITGVRLLKLDSTARTLEVLARDAVTDVRVLASTLVVSAGDKELRFEGIEDPEAARSALESTQAPPAVAPEAAAT